MSETVAWVLVAMLLAVCTVLFLKRGQNHEPAEAVEETPPSTLPENQIVERMREGVVVVNETLTPVLANEAARAMLGFAPKTLPATLRSDEMISMARRAIAEGAPIESDITLWPKRLTVQLRILPLEEPYGAAIFLNNITQEARLQQVRRQFVVNASHELKTPVTGLMALAEAVRNALPDDVAAAERMSEQLIQESERLSKLTQDLLDLSRVEDPASLRTISVQLDEIARQEVVQLKDLAEDRSVDVVVQADQAVYVRGDEQQLGLMIRNLVDNAIRYTDTGGSITVDVSSEDDNAVVVVADTGIGIPLRDQARVFERFYRVDEGRSRAIGGTGLGLSIVRHVAEVHGGYVSLESELGEGSSFTVRLPLVEGESS